MHNTKKFQNLLRCCNLMGSLPISHLAFTTRFFGTVVFLVAVVVVVVVVVVVCELEQPHAGN